MDAAPRFAATKIRPPRARAARVPRPDLEAALTKALRSARVLLLQAPAGFGKTSALAAALPDHAALAWVSLDEDDDAQRLVACLAAALEPLDLPWRTAPEALAALPLDARGSPSRAIGELVNALADAETPHGVIVLDDLHRCSDTGLHRGLELLIERLPSNWTLVLASRSAPPLALARWRAAGELVTFEQEALAFTAEETRALAASEGLDAGQAAALHERTAGWPAGVRLGLSVHKGTPAARAAGARLDRPLFEFLASEVLDQLPAELHDFLLRVALLPSFTAAEAAAASGDARAALWMDEIEQRGLFATVLDGAERTLVLHDLLRDALAERLLRRHPDERPRVLRRAAQSSGDPMRRVPLLLRIPDVEAAAQALADAAGDLLVRGGAPQLERAIAGFPADARATLPTLRRLAAMAAYLRWDWEACAREAQAASALAAERGQAAEHQLAQAYLALALYPLDRNDESQALIAALSAEADLNPRARLIALMADASQHLRRGELPELPALYARVLALIESGGSLLNWWEVAPPVNWTTLPGMRRLVERYLAGARAQIRNIGDEPLPMVADLRLLEAFDHLWAGRVDASLATAELVAQDLRWLAVAGEVAVNLDVLRLLQAAMLQRTDEAHARIEALLARVESDPEATPERRRLWQHHIAIYGVRMADLLGEGPDAIAHWAARLRENPLHDPSPSNARAIFTRARHAAALGRWRDAAALFVQLLPRTPRMDVMGQAIEAQLRAAHALMQCQRLDEAAAALAPALVRIERDGELGQALLIGPTRLHELARARWETRLSQGEQATLAAAAQLADGSRADTSAPSRAADALLSEREQEVLRALAEGQSNKLIARELDISPHTVKRHVANILDKLGLASRGQAAAWLRRREGAA